MSHHGHTQGQGHSHADAEGPTAILVEEHELILGFPRQAGPIAVMLADHEAGRGFVRGMAEAAEGVGTDPGAPARLIETGRAYIQLLRSHIQRENSVLFPMAEARMGPAGRAQLAEAFERFEAEETGAGIHERSLRLLRMLTATP
jgi:hemerythrin-like domain-containing protein